MGLRRELTGQVDAAMAHGELLFGALAQYERALTRERVLAGLAAKRRDQKGGREKEPIDMMTRPVSPA